jgi:predicted MPP superfamily phosphohydrolase
MDGEDDMTSMTWPADVSEPARRAIAALAGTAAVGAGALAWSLVEAQLYALRWVTVPAMARDAGPLRLLHLSDLHLLPGQRRKRDFVRRCLVAGPDMVVVTGDILGHPDAIDEAVALLAPLADGRLCLFSLGSNDFYAPAVKSPSRYFRPAPHVLGARLDTSRLVDGLVAEGWTCVENRRLTLATRAGRIDVLGLGDAHVDHDRPGEWAEPDVDDPVLRLGVAHAPYLRVLAELDRRDVDLAVAGHTHGGQVRLPGYGALVDNCDLPLRQARGLSAHTPSMWLHVSAGLGANRFTPIRFACRPEATILDVVARAPGDMADVADATGATGDRGPARMADPGSAG